MAASGAAISECSIDVEAPKAGSKPQTKIEDTDRYKGDDLLELHDGHVSGEYGIYGNHQSLTAKEGYAFFLQPSARSKGADVTSEVITSDAGESILQVKAKFAKTGASVDSGNSQTNGQSGNTAQGSVSGDSGGNLASGRREHPHPELAAPHLADPLATAAAPHLRFRTASMKRLRLPLLPMKR